MRDTLQCVDENLALCVYRIADLMNLPAQNMSLAQAAVIYNQLQKHLHAIEKTRDIARVWRNLPAIPPATIDVE